MNALEFPFVELPANGETREVAPGVYWLRMGLPLALDHINLYLLEAGEGWYAVDTGMNLDSTRDSWELLFAGPMQGRPLLGVIATHMHPDHVGLAGWLCERFRVPLYMTFGEYFSARAYTAPPTNVSWTSEEFFRRIGLGDEFVGTLKRRMRGFGALVSELPGAYRRLLDGDILTIGAHRWRVVVGTGHSPEHACLYCETLGVLLAGDQVIAGITSNVSVMASEPEANPLAGWLDSHRKFMQLPADTLVLPAHNLPFRGLHQRLQALIDHHEDHMLAIEEACVQPKSVIELLPVLFARKIGDAEITMAIGECLSHLHLLMQRGRIERTLDAGQGIYRYRSIDPTLARRATGHHPRDPMALMV